MRLNLWRFLVSRFCSLPHNSTRRFKAEPGGKTSQRHVSVLGAVFFSSGMATMDRIGECNPFWTPSVVP